MLLAARSHATTTELLAHVRTGHFEAILDSIAAGRAELIRMFRAGEIDTKALRALGDGSVPADSPR